MKIQFDPNLDFQKQAIESVAGVFEGQEICQTNFTVAPLQYTTHQVIPGMENNLGIGNRLKLLPEDIHKNIRKIQLQNGLAPSEKMDSMDFTVEMETGTGKTYVYLRFIFEMNRLYGFTKFIIVVPSIAIKEGVAKSLEITAEHFKELYENVTFDAFVYKSSKLSNVRNFATSPDIQIMVIKQIEVAGVEVKDGHNKAYIKLLSVNNKKSPITAKIEIDCRMKNGNIKRKSVVVSSGADLLDAKYSGGRDIYDGYIIEDIYCEKGNEYISFTSKPEILKLGQAIGEVDPDEYKRLQIRKTIEEHLDKEMRLRPQGIKLLSLFFIDKVANYRWYDKEGSPQKGKFALMFEEEYARAIRKPKYNTLFEGADLDTVAAGVHNGYFAVDKKKDATGNKMLKDASGKTAADESAYSLIMKEKEKLLSFDSKLKFIFSHSALKEGWDNPNVFQICTLNETNSVIKKRQEIGRGLRICVNQDGERVHGFEVNTLTVMANESYEKFAEQLQKEIEQEEGIKFGVVEEHLFANIVVPVDDYNNEYLGVDASKKLWNHLKTTGYIDNKGKVQDSLKTALKSGELELPEEFKEHAPQIAAVLKKVSGNLNIKNRDDKKKVSLNKAVFLSPEFKELWDRIKYKTTFRVDFDVEALASKCAEEIKANLQVGKARFIYRKAKAEIDRGGVHAEQVQETASVYESRSFELPDLITYLQNETNLTRRTIVKIINDSGRLESFKNNPQKFIEQVSTIIQHQMRLFVVDGIKYHKLSSTIKEESLFKIIAYGNVRIKKRLNHDIKINKVK